MRYVDNTPAPTDWLSAGSWVYPWRVKSRRDGFSPDVTTWAGAQPEQRAPVSLCPGRPTYSAVVHVFGLVFWYPVADISTIIRILNDVPYLAPRVVRHDQDCGWQRQDVVGGLVPL